MKTKLILLGLYVSIISACSSIEVEKPVSYYVLDDKPAQLTKKNTERTISIDQIILPDYLNQPNLVLRDASQKLHVAYYHSWADDLSAAIRRVVTAKLNALDKQVYYTSICEECERLTIVLDHFYPTTQGEVILAGEYQLSLDTQQLTRQSFLIKTELQQDGYEHAVKKMQLVLNKLAVDIQKSVAVQVRKPIQKVVDESASDE